MLNLTSYMDETGHSDDPTLEYVGMAGFIAPYGAWEIFESGWADLLRNGGLNEPFHMKEFAHFTEQFKTWRSEDDQKRKAFMRRAMELKGETRATPIGAAV